jgi:2-dehydropantoate 2-reductase
MKIAVLGAGGVGGYYAGLLARAGADVHVIARGPHLAAIVEHGLKVRAPDEDWTVRLRATDDADVVARSFGSSDCLVLALKTYSLDEAARSILAFSAQGVAVVPLLNGIDTDQRLLGMGVSRDQLLGGLTYISAVRVGPGVIERRSPFQRVVLGVFDRLPDARAYELAAALRAAGAEADTASDIHLELWRKFILLTAISAACTIVGGPIGDVRQRSWGSELLRQSIAEACAVASSSGVAILPTEAARIRAVIDDFPATMKPSLVHDLETGARTEIDALSGALCARGRTHSLDCPVHEAAVSMVRCRQRLKLDPMAS